MSHLLLPEIENLMLLLVRPCAALILYVLLAAPTAAECPMRVLVMGELGMTISQQYRP